MYWLASTGIGSSENVALCPFRLDFKIAQKRRKISTAMADTEGEIDDSLYRY